MKKLLLFSIALLTLSCSSSNSNSMTPEEVTLKAHNIMIDAFDTDRELLDFKKVIMEVISANQNNPDFGEDDMFGAYFPSAVAQYGDILSELYCSNGAKITERDLKLLSFGYMYSPDMYATQGAPALDKCEIINSATLEDGKTAVVKIRMYSASGTKDLSTDDWFKILKLVDGKWKIDAVLDGEIAERSVILAEYEKLIAE